MSLHRILATGGTVTIKALDSASASVTGSWGEGRDERRNGVKIAMGDIDKSLEPVLRSILQWREEDQAKHG